MTTTSIKIWNQELYSMDANEINQAALTMLGRLLERCTLHLATKLTGVSRTTLYKWLDEDLPLDAMSSRDSAWFILICETNPKIRMLMDRAPLTHKRMAHKLIEGMTT